MSYNKQYNTRNSSGRYNTSGQFVSAGELVPGRRPRPPPAASVAAPPPPPPLPPTPMGPAAQSPFSTAAQRKQGPAQPSQNLQAVEISDVEMKPSLDSTGTVTTASDGTPKPHWMKSKLQGVKKVSNRERRRRQNENLRRLLTPKNALMVLNEMLPNEQITNQFKVEPAAQGNFNQYNFKQHSFCADLNIKGNHYKGYGENKLLARNVAAEQAIRDLVIQKMNKALVAEGAEEVSNGGEGEEEPLPMIQLASFALHKLFSEWEYEGHKVPQLKPRDNSVGDGSMEVAEGGTASGAGAAAGGKRSNQQPAPTIKKKDLPLNASSMHPCMLLTYMRPHLQYRELAVEGDRPQNMTFTLGVDVDGSTYIGKASNKKEARKQAAMSACTSLWGVRFVDKPADNTPQLPA